MRGNTVRYLSKLTEFYAKAGRQYWGVSGQQVPFALAQQDIAAGTGSTPAPHIDCWREDLFDTRLLNPGASD